MDIRFQNPEQPNCEEHRAGLGLEYERRFRRVPSAPYTPMVCTVEALYMGAALG